MIRLITTNYSNSEYNAVIHWFGVQFHVVCNATKLLHCTESYFESKNLNRKIFANSNHQETMRPTISNIITHDAMIWLHTHFLLSVHYLDCFRFIFLQKIVPKKDQKLYVLRGYLWFKESNVTWTLRKCTFTASKNVSSSFVSVSICIFHRLVEYCSKSCRAYHDLSW